MGYTSVQAQLMTVPVYAVTFVGTLTVPYFSDRFAMRGPFIVALSLVVLVGVVMTVATYDNKVQQWLLS